MLGGGQKGVGLIGLTSAGRVRGQGRGDDDEVRGH